MLVIRLTAWLPCWFGNEIACWTTRWGCNARYICPLGVLDIATRRKHCHIIAINIQEDANDAEVDMGDCAVLGMSFGESVVLESWLTYTN